MELLITKLEACTACEFHNPEFKPLAPAGSSSLARIMFLGENPSWASNQATAFAPTTISGRALRENYLKPLGVSESQAWITDLFKCRYPKDVYLDKSGNESLIQRIACECAKRWLVWETELARPTILVTLGDKEVYQRIRKCFRWQLPKVFEEAVGLPHQVQLGERTLILFPMVHPDISRPVDDVDKRKIKVRTKWAPLNRDMHIPALKELLDDMGE